ncbi:MAG: hypothetical protein HOO96_37710, partial [Polyangiaceae bacterium]|nr:hypothetical protein [Polyangiaceae bacterium]
MSFDGHNLPAPVDWQKFERLCRDLWAAIWEDRNTQAHGRSGQPQHGVDVFGIPNGERVYSAVQCKRRGSSADAGEVTESELREEVAKAQNFVPKIGGAFILATTGPRDAKIQRVARILSEQQRANGQFSVHVWSWDDIQAEIGRRDSVFAQHFADLIGTVRSFDREHSLETEGDVRHPTVRAHAGAASSRSAQVTEPAAVLEPEHRAQIDAIRRVLQDGQPTMALQQAEALRARVWSAASASPRAHLLALIGHTKLALGEETAAAKLFVQMVDHTPSDPGSQANAALGHLILGSNAAALAWAQKALAQAPTEATAAQVSVLLDPRPDADVLATYEAVLGQRSELFSALADRAMKRGDIEMGKRWFLEALALAPDDAEVLGATGCVLVDEISAVAEVRDLLTAQERAQLVRGIELVGRAWALLKDNAVRKARLAWLVSGAEAKRLLRAPDAAATADEALAVGGALPELIALRAAIASDVGDHQRVCELLEKLPNPNVGVRGLLAAARANLGDVAGALTAWEDLLACELPLAIREQAEQNYVYTLISLQRGSDARCTVERWLTETPDDLGRVLVACDTASRLGDGAFRDAQLNRAVALARSDTSSRLLLRLGDALMRAGRPSDAADIFGLA